MAFASSGTEPAQRCREIKIVLLGDSGVGKSSIAQRYVTDTFRPHGESTIGASFMSKMIVNNGSPCKCQIWDTAGQEKYHSLAPMYYRGAAAAILVYDMTKKSSFEKLQKWVDEKLVDGLVLTVGRVGKGLGFFCAWIDKNIVDGTVNLVGNVTQAFGSVVRLFQTGRIQQYVSFAVAGGILVAAFHLLT